MTSSLETFDLDTGETTVVLTTDRLIEAPNWSPDGAFLVVNGDGRLFRVPLDAPALEAIDTPVYKIASGDITHRRLIEAVAATGRPVLLATGASTRSRAAR